MKWRHHIDGWMLSLCLLLIFIHGFTNQLILTMKIMEEMVMVMMYGHQMHNSHVNVDLFTYSRLEPLVNTTLGYCRSTSLWGIMFGEFSGIYVAQKQCESSLSCE